ncbi:MAG: homocysteine S-methyltransferase family protein [Chloroflexota bacterium]
MMAQSDLMTRLNNGELLILDGGTGTELEHLGAPMHSGVWCGAANGSHPHLVRQVHERYIAAGVDIITTNTYASGREALAKSNLEAHFEDWNKTAVSLAMEAREKTAVDRPIYIAGSIAPYDNWAKYDINAMRAAYDEQSQLLAEGGVDFLLLEMLGTGVENSVVAIEEAAKTGLPIWVSLSCLDHPTTGEIFLGAREESEVLPDEPEIQPYEPFKGSYEPFGPAIDKIMAAGGSVLSVMHSEIRVMESALQVARERWSGPIGAYPNSGHWERPNWAFKANVSADFYAQEAQKWVAAGAQVVGGCCGVGQHHIQAMTDALR